MNRSETLTETQAAADRQEIRGEEKERQTENVYPDVNLTLDSESRREMWVDRWNKGGDVIGQQQQEDTRQAADDDDDETRQGGQQEQENRQEVGKGGENLEERIGIVKSQMQQEERQEQMNGEDEARRGE